MDKKIDSLNMEKMLEALIMAKDYRAAQERKREEKLWVETNIPCRLNDIINRLTKKEMDDIRKHLGLQNLSGLKKRELADELVKLIPEHAGIAFKLFDQERYRLAKRILQNDGFIYENNLDLEKVEYLRGRGIIFPGSKAGKKVLFMPLELLEAFWEMDTPEFKKLVNRNTEWIRLTHGLLYYYGAVSFTRLVEIMEKYTGERPDTIQYMNILYDAEEYYKQIKYYYEQVKSDEDKFGFCNMQVFDAQGVLREQRARPDIDYYPFTKGQLIKAADEGYIDRTPAFIHFINFLLYHYELTRAEADEIAGQCVYIIRYDGKPGEVIKYLENVLEFPSLDVVQQLTAEIMHLYNNTRLWILKGHTPEEVFQGEKQHLQPLSLMPFTVGETGAEIAKIAEVDKVAEIIDNRTRTKVGRNDPCPCGSGKKFKKCCGK